MKKSPTLLDYHDDLVVGPIAGAAVILHKVSPNSLAYFAVGATLRIKESTET
jgi:hypothetical protein